MGRVFFMPGRGFLVVGDGQMIPRFEGELHVELLPSGMWRLSSPLGYYSSLLDEVVRVPQGFETDFASVPRMPLAFLLTGDTAHAAAVVHDWLCEHPDGRERELIDRVFLEACEVSQVPRWRRWLMYRAVRLADWIGLRK